MLQNSYRIPFLLLGTVLSAGAAVAQSSGTQSASSNPASSGKSALDEIVVTATRLETPLRDVPASVSVVSKNDIQLGRQQLSLAESLDRVPGVFMQDRYNFAQGLRVSIRGFGARANFGVRGVKIIIDGIPATLPDGQASADDVNLGTTSRIEVIRGPSSTLYGNASGGVINITTEPPPKQPFAELRVSGGDFGFQKTQLKAGGQGDKVGYIVSASDWKYDGFREHGNAEKEDLTGRFNFDLGRDRKLLATVSYAKQPLSNDPGGVTAALAENDPTAARPTNIVFDSHQNYDQTSLGFVYDTPLNENNSLTARNYYVWRNFTQFLPFQAGGVPSFKRFFAGGGLNFNHDGFWLDRPDKFVVGFDAEDQDDDRTLYDNDNGIIGVQSLDQNENVTSSGLFLQNQLSITKQMQLTLGARYDQVTFDVTDHFLSDGDDSGKVTESSTSPMAGLVYTLSPAINVYGKYSTSFETPTTTEYYNPTGAGGFNQSLKPQLATNYEVGMRGVIANRHQYEFALFTVGVKDELIPFQVPNKPDRDFYVNAGKSTRNGVEFSLVSHETDRIRTTFSYTYSDFTFDRFIDADGNNFSGNTIPGTAKDQIYAEVSYEDPHGWFGSLEALHIGKQYADNANTATNAPYTLTDIRFGYQLDSGSLHVTPFLAVNNIFDKRYNANVRINAFGGRYYEAAPGRNVFAGVTLNFQHNR